MLTVRLARRFARILAALIAFASGEQAAFAQMIQSFDLTKDSEVQAWQPAHDVAPLQGSAEGMVIRIVGADPYIIGPPRDFPPGQLLWLRLRLRPDQAGTGQVFYFNEGPSEANSVRFPVRGGAWQEVRVPLPPLGPGYRLRLDPPGAGGSVVVASLSVEARLLLQEPSWPKPTAPALRPGALSLASGDLRLVHARDQFGGFALEVAGRRMAVGFTRPLIGYVREGQQRWLDLAERATVRATKEQNPQDLPSKGKDALVVRAVARDKDGGAWEIRQRFSAARAPGAIAVETTVTVDRDRTVAFLPMLALLPGLGSFGASKSQGLFAGLEYLDNEPSSSQADVVGPASKRQVPDSLQVTFPLMAIAADDRYMGLIWEQDPAFCALFDSPDRLFASGAHVMGLLFPGSNGGNRAEGSLLPYGGERLAAGKPLILRATLIGGKGKSVVPAVQQYVALRGLPPVPAPGMDLQGYVSLAAAGWLDSRIREGDRYRHAYPGGFFPQPAADAALMMDWLARQATDAALSRRLAEAARGALAQVKPEDYNAAQVSHVRYPVAPLVYGGVAENTNRARETGRGLLARFEPGGAVPYRVFGDPPRYRHAVVPFGFPRQVSR
jgi:hypothetical protein